MVKVGITVYPIKVIAVTNTETNETLIFKT